MSTNYVKLKGFNVSHYAEFVCDEHENLIAVNSICGELYFTPKTLNRAKLSKDVKIAGPRLCKDCEDIYQKLKTAV